MEDNSYKELMDFLGSQFGRIDEQLAEMRLETKQGLDDVKRHNEILIEDVKHGLQAIVDGQRMHDEKQGRDNAELVDRFARLDKFDMHLMADIDDHDKRIKALEKKS